VRAEAATALGRLPAESVIPAMVDWLEDENAHVRQAITRAIAAIRARAEEPG
jgi:HEAT repeat protein